jgi:tetratricopeptide (TPR) repeat protein
MSQRLFLFILSLCLLFAVPGCKGPDDERIESADLLFERAVQYTERGRFDEAEAAFRNLLDVDRDLGRTDRVAMHQQYIGLIAEQQGRFDDAREWYSRSIETSRRAASHAGILDGMHRMASLAATTGDAGTQRSHLQDALTYTQFFSYPRGEATTSLSLGQLEAAGGRTDLALKHFTNAVHIASRLNDPPLHYRTRLLLADNFIERRQYTEALEHLDEARRLDSRITDPVEKIGYTLAMGRYYEQAGHHGEALRLYEEAWNAHRENPQNSTLFLELLTSLADSYLQYGRYRDALSHFDLLTDLSRDYGRQITHGYAILGKSDSFLKFGIVVDNDDYIHQAIQLAREAEAHFGHLEYFYGQAYAVFQQARGVSLINRPGEAVRLYIHALSYITETVAPDIRFPSQRRFEERNMLSDPRSSITDFLVNELIAAGRYDDAFVFSEQARHFSLNEQVLRIGLTSSDPSLAALADSLTGLYRKMTALDHARLLSHEETAQLGMQRERLRTMISDTRNTIASLQDAIGNALPNSRRLFDKEVPARDELGRAVPAGKMLVSYVPTHTHLHTFLLTRNGLRVHSQEIPREELNRNVSAFQQLVSSPVLFASEERPVSRSLEREYDAAATWMYRTFIDPVLPTIGNNTPVIFVLPPDMHDIPLHALREPRGRRQYTAERFRISYLPSATVLTFRLQQPRRVYSIAAFGNPDGIDWNIDYELRDIRGIFRDARIHLEGKASIEELTSERGDILHIATEFYFQPDFPEHSYFLLTGYGSTSVRRFGLEYLTGLHSFPHVILTNSGDVVEGLNVLHPYFFFLNGGNSIAVNHWQREPRSAKWFNENIYSNLSIEHTFLNAFHQAQSTLISTSEYSHPHFWGLFFIYSP